jgi:hypothetical protein
MNVRDLSTAKDPDLRAALGALRRAALLARRTAIQTSTHLVIVERGRLRRVPAVDLQQIEANRSDPA